MKVVSVFVVAVDDVSVDVVVMVVVMIYGIGV